MSCGCHKEFSHILSQDIGMQQTTDTLWDNWEIPLSMDNTKGQKENENGDRWETGGLLRVKLSEWKKT